MFHRSVLLFVIASLVVSGSAAWATSIFVNINSFNVSATTDLTAYPTGVSPLSAGGGVCVEGAQTAGANYYDVCYYSGGTAGTMTSMASALSYSGATFARAMGSAMNDQGDFASTVFTNTPQVQWLTTNRGSNTTYDANVPSGSGQQIRGIGIDENDDICGTYTGRPTTSGAWPDISINNGGGSFTTYTPTSTFDSWVAAMSTPTTVGGTTSGWAAGFGKTGSPPRDHPEVWSYSITGGVMTSSVTDLMGGTGYAPLSGAYSSVTAASAIAINSSGVAVIAAENSGTTGSVENNTEGLLYNINTQVFTPLVQGANTLKFTDSVPGTITEASGHDQAIDNNGDVVGYIGASGSTWHAAMWQSGVITDLNTLYASVLPTGVVLNNATAIDNNGDIAGVCTVNGTAMQAFVIYNAAATPEPGTLVLLAAGLVGLLAFAWRKKSK